MTTTAQTQDVQAQIMATLMSNPDLLAQLQQIIVPASAPMAAPPAAPAPAKAKAPRKSKLAPPAQNGGVNANGYGVSPVIAHQNPVEAARLTHKARVDAIEAAIPGFTAICHVYTVGKDHAGQFTKQFTRMVNSPFTWIDMPGGKAQTMPGMTPEALRSKLKSLGYGFSHANKLWATDSKGHAIHRTFGKVQGVGRAMRDSDS